MGIAGKLNLLIQQGSDNPSPSDLQFRHTVIASSAVSGGTSIPVYELPVAIPNGTVLKFGSVSVTSSGTNNAGATTLTVSSFTGTIAADTQASGPPIDLTGYGFASKMRASYDDPTALITVGVSATNIVDGRVRLIVPNATSAIVAPNIKWYELPPEIKTDPAALQDDTLFSRKALSAAYVWDFEWTTPGGLIERKLEGYSWVTPEATK